MYLIAGQRLNMSIAEKKRQFKIAIVGAGAAGLSKICIAPIVHVALTGVRNCMN